MNIMLDLETLGNSPNSCIVSIGAVKFGEGKIHETFYHRVDARSCVDIGLKIDLDTIFWWFQQSSEARNEIIQPGKHINETLLLFANFIGNNKENVKIWGNGASFDNVILSECYKASNFIRPWTNSNDRCYRTVKALYPEVKIERIGTHHNSLDDATSQALHLMKMIKTD